MRILVTGTGGFIGRALVEHALAEGHEVVAQHRGAAPVFEAGRPTRVRGDLAAGLPDLGPVDLVVHAAAHTHLKADLAASTFIASNVTAVQALAAWARRTRPRLLVFLSTLSIYGRIQGPLLTEATPLDQPDLYGTTKYLGEQVVGELAPEVPVAVLRLPGVVGRGCFTPWLGRTLERAARHQPIQVYNPDNPFNNVIDTLELHRLIAHLADRPPGGLLRLNLGASAPIPVREVVARLLEGVGSSSALSVGAAQGGSFRISTEALEATGFRPASTGDLVDRYVRCNLDLLHAMHPSLGANP